MTHNQYTWKPEISATVIVVLLIGERVISRFTGTSEEITIWEVIAILAIPVLGYFHF